LILLGEEDDLRDPEMLSRMKSLDFLAVITSWFPENLSRSARVLIPKPLWLEEDGTYASLEGRRTGLCRGVLTPPPGVKPARETLAALGARFGLGKENP
jgi:predicted molibdopterin-dependent oxidoreductase YjgC